MLLRCGASETQLKADQLTCLLVADTFQFRAATTQTHAALEFLIRLCDLTDPT